MTVHRSARTHGPKIEFPGDGGLRIEASSTVTGTVNCTRDGVGNLNSISLLSLLGSARRRLVAGDGDYDSLGARLEARRRLTPRVSVRGRAAWHDRRFRASRHLDGPVRDLSLQARWVVTPTVRLDGALGYGAERPDRLQFRNVSRCGWVRKSPCRGGSQWA